MNWTAHLNGWERGAGTKTRRLANALERALIAGAAGPLPAERRLAAELHVSRGTVSTAYALLKDLGLITSRAGGYTQPDARNLQAPVRAARLAARGVTQQTMLAHYVDRDPAALDLSLALLGIPAGARDLVAHAYATALATFPPTEYLAAGRPELRDRIAAAFRARNVPTSAEQIVVTQGAYQGIVLATLLALQPGDRVAFETPLYPGALDIFRARAGVDFHAVEAYDRPGVLDALARRSDISMLYATSVYRNPAGSVMDAATGERLAHLADRANIVLVDDRALEECGLRAQQLTPLAAYRPRAPILTLGSLDKTTGAGTRIGWIRAPLALVPSLTRLKVLLDLASPAYLQGVALQLFDHLDAIARLRRAELRQRYEAVAAILRRDFPAWRWNAPHGGASLWVDIGTDTRAYADAAAARGVKLVAGDAFAEGGAAGTSLRIAYAQPEATLARGLSLLRQPS